MQEWLRERGVFTRAQSSPSRTQHGHQSIAIRSGLGILSLGKTKSIKSPAKAGRSRQRNAYNRLVVANLSNSFV